MCHRSIRYRARPRNQDSPGWRHAGSFFGVLNKGRSLSWSSSSIYIYYVLYILYNNIYIYIYYILYYTYYIYIYIYHWHPIGYCCSYWPSPCRSPGCHHFHALWEKALGYILLYIIYLYIYIYRSIYLCMMLWLHVHLRHDGNNYLIYRSYSSSTTGHVIVVWSSQSTGIRLETSDEDGISRQFCQLEVHIPHSAPRNKQSPFQACWTTMPRCSMVLKYLPIFTQKNGPHVGIYSSTMEFKRWINHGKKKTANNVAELHRSRHS